MNVLVKNLEYFLNNNNINKNKEFKAYFYQDDDKNNFKIIYDEKNYIHYLLNIQKEKEYIIKEKIEYEILITDSSYDILFYKNQQSTISCLLILIINDIEFKITNENYLEFNLEKFRNINDDETIIEKTKQKIINYIKQQKVNNTSSNIETLLLGGKEFNFLYNENLINNENLKELCSIITKIEIKNDNFDNNNDNIFMNVYEILSPSYKSLLAEKYLNEMPSDLFDLMIKYKDIYITQDLFNSYKKRKNKNIKFRNKENHNKNIKNNKIKKIVFHLDKGTKNIKKKIKFKVIFRKIKSNNNKNKIINIKKNIFQIHRRENIYPNENIEMKDDKINIANKNNNIIFKCEYLNSIPEKKYLFKIKK